MDPIEERLRTSQPIENQQERALLNILHTSNALRNHFAEYFKQHGLTEPQFNVLRILRGQHGKPMNLFEIGDRMVHRESNVSRIVDKLEAKGLVVRKEDETNRRRVDISIKPEGVAILESMRPKLYAELDACFERLSSEELRTLNTLLDKIQA
jgi:DNA-binding MarR family transcriptional regulator